AKDIFTTLIGRLKNGYLKLDSELGFMPAIVEDIGEIKGYGKLYSVAHYGKLNGDAMRDPDVTFVEKIGEYYPVSFRNDYLAVDQEVFKYDADGNVIGINFRLQHQITDFANLWMRNIKNQQRL
ncbi:MAG: hypothetical protein PHV82_11835, partial [Victivallaceae bacterium]|nr:hypothetical protein [Victivallaceae bacterium]